MSFTQLDICDLPVLILGVFINNLYDHKRSIFKRNIRYTCVSHSCEGENILIKGAVLKPNRTGKTFLAEINTFPQPSTFKKYNLTCNDNFKYNRNGLHIIDMNCINIVSDYNIDPRQLLDVNDDLPWFSYFIDIKLFCLTSPV